jgi:3-hydroxyisobutyrate dehydrogenase
MSLPLAKQTIENYQELSENGEGRSDTSVLMKAIAKTALDK